MSIEKYLDNIKFQEIHPGPFAVRLKYELKKEIFESRRRLSFYPAFSTAFGLLMLIVSSSMVLRPDIAKRIHFTLNPAEKRQMEVHLSGDGHYLGTPRTESKVGHNNFHYTSGSNVLPELDEDKTYIIKRIRDDNNRSFYFIREIEDNRTPRVVY